MKELEKLKGIASKQVHAAPHETLLVLDGTTGQNALSQAQHFKDSVGITGVVLTKLDGTAKGGVVFAIGQTLEVPVRFIGVGEGIDDLIPFDPKAFVEGLFE
jgi:fused signal recognition particle receptor